MERVRSSDQTVPVIVEVTIGTPVPAQTPTPTGIATWPSEKRPEARATMPPASDSTRETRAAPRARGGKEEL